MAYYYKVKIIRAKQQISKTFGPVFNHGDVDAFIRKAAAMPATVRVEVDMTDTQLYGWPMAERTSLCAVVTKTRAYKLYGRNPDVALLHDGPLRTFHIA